MPENHRRIIFGAGDVDPLFHLRLAIAVDAGGEGAVWIGRAGEEPPSASREPIGRLGAAFGTLPLGRRHFGTGVGHRLVGFGERFGEGVVERVQRGDPVGIIGGDAVEIRFHRAGVSHVHQPREGLGQLVGDDLANGCWVKGPLDLLHVLLLNLFDDAGVGGRSADALPLKMFDERGLGVA